MDMVPYLLAGIPLAIALRLGIYWLGERARRRRSRAQLRKQWEARYTAVAATTRHGGY